MRLLAIFLEYSAVRAALIFFAGITGSAAVELPQSSPLPHLQQHNRDEIESAREKSQTREELEKAYSNARAQHNLPDIISLSDKLSTTYLAYGENDRALRMLSELETFAASLEEETDYAEIYLVLAKNYQRMQMERKARDYFMVAVSVYQENNQEASLSAALNELAINDALLGETELAIQAFNESFMLAVKLGNRSMQLTTGLNLCRAKLDAEQTDDLANVLAIVTHLVDELDAAARVQPMLALASLYRGLSLKTPRGEYWRFQAYQTYVQAREVAVSVKDSKSASYSSGHIARLYADEGRVAEAIHFTEEALRTSLDSGLEWLTHNWLIQLARYHREQEQVERALYYYLQLLETLKSYGELKDLATETIYQTEYEPAIREYIDLVLATSRHGIEVPRPHLTAVFEILAQFSGQHTVLNFDKGNNAKQQSSTPLEIVLRETAGELLFMVRVGEDVRIIQTAAKTKTITAANVNQWRNALGTTLRDHSFQRADIYHADNTPLPSDALRALLATPLTPVQAKL